MTLNTAESKPKTAPKDHETLVAVVCSPRKHYGGGGVKISAPSHRRPATAWEGDDDPWEILPDLDLEDDDQQEPYGEVSTEEKAQQLKVREQLIKQAASTLAQFTDLPEDWIEWRDGAIEVFAAAGRKEVLLPHFRETATDMGWSKTQISEMDRWAHVVLKAAISGCSTALSAFGKAPANSGSLAFARMRRQFEFMGSYVKNKLRLQIEKFAPIVGEEPPTMIDRLDALYKKHAMQMNLEPQSEESKIRKVLEIAEMYDQLEGKVRAIKERTTGASADPRKCTYEYICMDINAQWLAWGKEDPVKIKVTRVEA
jgi:hypothetical protein